MLSFAATRTVMGMDQALQGVKLKVRGTPAFLTARSPDIKTLTSKSTKITCLCRALSLASGAPRHLGLKAILGG